MSPISCICAALIMHFEPCPTMRRPSVAERAPRCSLFDGACDERKGIDVVRGTIMRSLPTSDCE